MNKRGSVVVAIWVLLAATAAGGAAAKKPWLGMALMLRNQPDGGKFLYVARAPEDAPAYRSGVREGDLITAIDGKRITFRDQLDVLEFSSKLTPGKVVKLRVIRAGAARELRVRIGELPAEYEELVAAALAKAREAREKTKE
jgi:serine protease Do